MSRKGRPSSDLTGIETRHQIHCASGGGLPCDCSPGYRASHYIAATGQTIRKTFTTPGAAQSWRNDREREEELGLLVPPSALNVNDALDEMFSRARAGTLLNKRKQRFKPSTLRGYEQAADKHLRPYIGHRRLTDLDAPMLQEEVLDRMLARDAAPTTVRNAFMALRVVCRRAMATRVLRFSPFTGLELPALRDHRWEGLQPHVIRQLADVVEPRDRALVGTALFAGLRRGELQALEPAHIDLDANRIKVRATWDRREGPVAPKSKTSVRDVPILAPLRLILEEHLHRTKPRRGHLVFGRITNRPFDPSTVAARLNKAWKAEGLPVLTFHQCRHAFASMCLAAPSANIKTLQVVMGHSSINVTLDIYGHLMPSGLDDFASAVDDFIAIKPCGD